MYLSFSGFKTYSQCPKQYWHKYVDKTTPPNPDNCVNALFGSTVGVLFEYFYAREYWRLPDVEQRMKNEASEVLDKVIREDQRGKILDWNDEKANYNNRDGLVEDIQLAIPRGLQIIRENRFLGPVSIAEMKLDYKYGNHMVGGRADFVIERSKEKDILILDGKGSKHGKKYVEDSQLKWYAFLYEQHKGRLPDKLGFVFWRFEGQKAVHWIDVDRADILSLRDEVLGTMDRVEKSVRHLTVLSESPKSHFEAREEYFPAQPSFSCNLCSYLPLCDDGKKATRTNGFGSKTPKATIPGSGVRELSLDD